MHYPAHGCVSCMRVSMNALQPSVCPRSDFCYLYVCSIDDTSTYACIHMYKTKTHASIHTFARHVGRGRCGYYTQRHTHATDTEKERESQDAHAYEHARAHAYERAHAHTCTQTVLHTLGTGRLPRVSWPFRTAVSTADNGRAFQASNMA